MNYKDTSDGQTPGQGLADVIAVLLGFNGATFDRVRSVGDNSDVVAAITNGLQRVFAEAAWFNGTAWERQRGPNVFKSLNAVAVGTEATIWTPAAGKKFRLMGFLLAQGTATGAVLLKDNTAGTTIFIIPPHTVGVAIASAPMGNGILSVAANNVLTATGVATETLTGVVFGTEE